MSFSDSVILAGFVFLVTGRLLVISISMVIIRPLVVVIILGSFRPGRLAVMIAIITVIVLPIVPIILIVQIGIRCRACVQIWI